MAYSAEDFQRYKEKAKRAMGEHPYRDELANRFALQLRSGTAPPVECRYASCRRGGPVTAEAFGGWVRDHRLAELRVHLESAEDAQFEAAKRRAVKLRLFAMRAAGWFQWAHTPVVRLIRRKRITWGNVRTK